MNNVKCGPGWPRIALVTAVFNTGRYIEATIRSVLAQEYPNLDYFIVDGGSTDGTVEIIRKYESRISGWVSEPDKGTYDAMRKGFERTSGRSWGGLMRPICCMWVVCGWSEAFFETCRTWNGSQEDRRLSAMTALPVGKRLKRWSRARFWRAPTGTSSRSRLLETKPVGSRGRTVETSCRADGDFELWVRFFRHAAIYSVDSLIGGFDVVRRAEPGRHSTFWQV